MEHWEVWLGMEFHWNSQQPPLHSKLLPQGTIICSSAPLLRLFLFLLLGSAWRTPNPLSKMKAKSHPVLEAFSDHGHLFSSTSILTTPEISCSWSTWHFVSSLNCSSVPRVFCGIFGFVFVFSGLPPTSQVYLCQPASRLLLNLKTRRVPGLWMWDLLPYPQSFLRPTALNST